MAHTFTTIALSRLGREARRRDDPSYFLDRFGPMHRRWHSLSSNARPLGFLLYHWHVIQAFKIAGGPRFVGGGSITPYTPANFAAFGWPYNVTAQASAGDVDSLANFSFEIEMWHNDAHMAIGMATDTPMMDPEENIWYLPFWRLHYFIDARFIQQLRRFDTRGTVRRRVRRLVARQHSDVARI
jgi:hypothetical protein